MNIYIYPYSQHAGGYSANRSHTQAPASTTCSRSWENAYIRDVGCSWPPVFDSRVQLPVDTRGSHLWSCMVLGIDPGRPCRPISVLVSIYLILILAYGLVEIKAGGGRRGGGGYLLTDWWGKGDLISRIENKLNALGSCSELSSSYWLSN